MPSLTTKFKGTCAATIVATSILCSSASVAIGVEAAIPPQAKEATGLSSKTGTKLAEQFELNVTRLVDHELADLGVPEAISLVGYFNSKKYDIQGGLLSEAMLTQLLRVHLFHMLTSRNNEALAGINETFTAVASTLAYFAPDTTSLYQVTNSADVMLSSFTLPHTNLERVRAISKAFMVTSVSFVLVGFLMRDPKAGRKALIESRFAKAFNAVLSPASVLAWDKKYAEKLELQNKN